MVGNNVKIENFIFDFLKQNSNSNDIKIHKYIYDILINCSYYSKNDILDRKMFTLYFTDEQLENLKIKQKKLGYEDNFSRFVRYAFFDFYMKEHNVFVPNKFFGERIDFDKFKELMEKCKNELMNGEFTSYDLDLLRDNEEYKDLISLYNFGITTEKIDFCLDFLEYDMLIFLQGNFEEGEIYSDLIGMSTAQHACCDFVMTENGEELDCFFDYDNIVPDTNSFYYLYLYYAFVLDSGGLDIDKIFDETEEHVDKLLEKYTFKKIIKYQSLKYNIKNINMIFDQDCLDNLKLNELIDLNENLDEGLENDDLVEIDEKSELDTASD